MLIPLSGNEHPQFFQTIWKSNTVPKDKLDRKVISFIQTRRKKCPRIYVCIQITLSSLASVTYYCVVFVDIVCIPPCCSCSVEFDEYGKHFHGSADDDVYICTSQVSIGNLFKQYYSPEANHMDFVGWKLFTRESLLWGNCVNTAADCVWVFNEI